MKKLQLALNAWYDYDSWENINGDIIPSVEFIYDQKMIYNIQPN